MKKFTQKFRALFSLVLTLTFSLSAQNTCDFPAEFSGNTGANMTVFITESFTNQLPELNENAYIVAHASNSAIIVGSTSLNEGEISALTIWGDDTFTTTIDGALDGEFFWLQLVNGNSVYNINDIVYQMGGNTYLSNGIVTITSCSFELYCSIEDSSVEEQIDYIIDDPCTSLSDYNSILLELNPIQKRDFNEGWNMFGFPCQQSRSVSETFAEIESDLYIVKNNEGNFYWPEFDFDGIGNLIPLEGYQTKLYNPISDFRFCTSSINLPDVNISGCSDCEACNYNPLATSDIDLNSTLCIYPNECYDCFGVFICGCTDDTAFNYNPDAIQDDGSCIDKVFGCTDASALNYNNEANTDDGSCYHGDIQVGDFAHGGIVFQINEDGTGLVSTLEDLIEGATDPYGWGFNGYEWGCYGESVNGAVGTSIGTGYQNTMDIVNQGCSTDIGGVTAAQAALDAEINGYSDWYLPSKDELVEMYNTIGNGGPEGNIGGFETSDWPYYWSSSQRDSDGAWGINFSNGGDNYAFMFNAIRVRVIRAF